MGAGGLAPGNSLASIELALRIGVDLVELDVWQTADGHLVLGHLPWIRPYEHTPTGRLARPRGWLHAARTLHTWPRIPSSTLVELRRLPSPPPTLAESLDLLRGRAIPYLDLRVTGVADQLCALLREGAPDGALLGSGPQRSLPEQALMPELVATSGFGVPFFGRALSAKSVAALTRTAIHNARRKGATGLSVEYHLVQPALLDLCAQEGFFVFAWTVNHPAAMRRLAALGVAGITSNRPDLFRAALQPEQASS
jgi:glycerophosphoryl diester phosphodiesterase